MEIIYCPNCGCKLNKGDKFCTKCGSKFPSGEIQLKVPAVSLILSAHEIIMIKQPLNFCCIIHIINRDSIIIDGLVRHRGGFRGE